MATIKLQDGKVVLKDGKASCSCCEYQPMIIFYSYDTDPTLGAGYDQCPNVGQPCGPYPTGSCVGAVASGFIYSDEWPSIPVGKTPKAKIYAGACMDDSGNIGSATTSYSGCDVKYTNTDVIDTAIMDGNRMKIPFNISNGPQGGPYGVCGATIEWYWE
jgi:hypothetical protein